MRSSRLLVLGALLAPVPAAAQSASPVPSVRVSATGEVRVKPDEGWVDLGVETQGASAQAAAEANASTMQRVIDALVRAGVPRDQVETQGFNVFPEYDGRPDGGEPRLRGYRVSNVVTAHVADVSRVGSVIDAGLGAGANRVNGVRFGVREAARYREQALQEAVRRGRAEAQVLAGALGPARPRAGGEHRDHAGAALSVYDAHGGRAGRHADPAGRADHHCHRHPRLPPGRLNHRAAPVPVVDAAPVRPSS